MKPRLNINESFICKIWENSDYYTNLQTSTGEDVEILSLGIRNNDSGPDYKNAKIKIEGKTLTGDIEIHRDFKNWAEHNHQKDRRYNSVILHVVLWDSVERTSPKLRIKRDLPTVILSNHLKYSIHDIWQEIINKPEGRLEIPCYSQNEKANDDEIVIWLEKLAEERLMLRVTRFKERLNEIGTNSRFKWDQVLYEFIFEALGYSKNKTQMLALAQNIDLNLLESINDDRSVLKIQAVLFGAGGFLFDLRIKDEYITKIKASWKDIESKISVPKLNLSEWNFFRMRPQNFPTVRIGYGSQIIRKLLYQNLTESIINIFDGKDFNSSKAYKYLLDNLKPEKDIYWGRHYNLGKESKTLNKLLGRQRFEDIVINVIIPFVYLFSQEKDKNSIRDNAIKLYNEIKIKPDNSIIRLMRKQLIKQRKIIIDNPAMEQALIQLYNFYCTRERCSNCVIGKKVFSGKGYEYKIIFY